MDLSIDFSSLKFRSTVKVSGIQSTSPSYDLFKDTVNIMDCIANNDRLLNNEF